MSHQHSSNDDRSNSMNQNNSAYQAAHDNHSDQLNPNNERYQGHGDNDDDDDNEETYEVPRQAPTRKQGNKRQQQIIDAYRQREAEKSRTKI